MRPKPFQPQPLDSPRPDFERDAATGQVWHRASCRVLSADTNRARIVHHAADPRSFEQGLIELRAVGGASEQIEASRVPGSVIGIEMSGHSPLRYDDLMRIHTRPAAMEQGTFRFNHPITRTSDGEVVCTGSTRHCAADSQGMQVEFDDVMPALRRSFPKCKMVQR